MTVTLKRKPNFSEYHSDKSGRLTRLDEIEIKIKMPVDTNALSFFDLDFSIQTKPSVSFDDNDFLNRVFADFFDDIEDYLVTLKKSASGVVKIDYVLMGVQVLNSTRSEKTGEQEWVEGNSNRLGTDYYRDIYKYFYTPEYLIVYLQKKSEVEEVLKRDIASRSCPLGASSTSFCFTKNVAIDVLKQLRLEHVFSKEIEIHTQRLDHLERLGLPKSALDYVEKFRPLEIQLKANTTYDEMENHFIQSVMMS
jgi:hypothetical protein